MTDPTIITGSAAVPSAASHAQASSSAAPDAMTPSATASSPAPRVGSALIKALAAEHAAIYAYGVIGGKTKGRLRAQAVSGFDAHRARRDQLRSLIAQRGGSPSEPGPAYQLPFEIRTPADAVRLAVLVEERLTTAYLELAADPDPSLRRLAALAAQECATRAYGWQPTINALPGMPTGQAGRTGQPTAPVGAEPATPGAEPSSDPS